ncbi:hypothetical protein AAFF_G00077640 [Aldrovandia affinis]|uniref:Uncharacterized protein n=1 Tax=Aldrovandia affinis TaxID=143900 RepID=A0AAD7S064_9TELE|nr:hypothetical protein AAFF_G00077640 [Aldrovandia affinis]
MGHRNSHAASGAPTLLRGTAVSPTEPPALAAAGEGSSAPQRPRPSPAPAASLCLPATGQRDRRWNTLRARTPADPHLKGLHWPPCLSDPPSSHTHTPPILHDPTPNHQGLLYPHGTSPNLGPLYPKYNSPHIPTALLPNPQGPPSSSSSSSQDSPAHKPQEEFGLGEDSGQS